MIIRCTYISHLVYLALTSFSWITLSLFNTCSKAFLFRTINIKLMVSEDRGETIQRDSVRSCLQFLKQLLLCRRVWPSL